ncbi:MAG: NADH-ubiquinone oxidoreductase-F iron-sulfur binding region domain-containing protein [Gemmatimonadota bacterium]|nr:NADH-ubiquinone oxidoreductase-F iron-sulfur binding region domain-containing protein [Gemmatimonadota bacterium]
MGDDRIGGNGGRAHGNGGRLPADGGRPRSEDGTSPGLRSPILPAHEWIERHGLPDAERIEILAADAGIPAASLRGAISFFSDLPESSGVVRVCGGTSCALAAGGALREALAGHEHCRTVYCLGYCDRSPAALTADGLVATGAEAWALADEVERVREADPVPEIRSLVDDPVVTARVGAGDHAPLASAREAGVWDALAAALEGSPVSVLEAVERSGERGRGGAAYPTGAKWRAAAETPAPERYVVANGDEGDPGSFVDRVLMERDPHALLEGMALCGYAVGASRGVVYVRSEYPRARAILDAAVGEARAAGLLGDSVLGSDFAFDVDVFPGMGSYVCGEETAMLNAIEGRRGEVRLRPPYPAEAGLFGRPTVVNNVVTLVDVRAIVADGPEAYRARGTPETPGTKALCLNAGFERPGILEVEFGTPLATALDAAGGGADGRPLEAVILGGPMGSVLGPEDWDVPICYSAMAERGIQLGHGGLVAVPEGTDWGRLLEHWLVFMAHESCGRCVPCRLGSGRALKRIRDGGWRGDPQPVERLFELMEETSLCAFGRSMPGPMRSILERAGP